MAELRASPQFKEWERKKKAAQRWWWFEKAKHAAGGLLLAGLAIYALHLSGCITLPFSGKFQF